MYFGTGTILFLPDLILFIRKIKAVPHPHLLELLLETRAKEELKNTIALKMFVQQIK
jgi:hypothetical protein